MQIFLASVSDKIRLVTGQACSIDVHTSYADTDQSTPPVLQGFGRLNTAITTATTTDIVAAPGSLKIRGVKSINIRNKHASSPCDVTVVYEMSGPTTFELFKVTLVAGAHLTFVEGLGWFTYNPAQASILFKVLSADDAGGQNVATVQPWFPTAGGVTVAADTTYYIEGLLAISRAAGAVSHTTSMLFGGTATLTSIQYTAKAQVGETDLLLPLSRVTSRVATAAVVKAASTTATEQCAIDLEGIVRINAAGTFIPQFIYSAAPGGAPTIKANSFFRMTPLGNGSVVAQGVWA